MQIASTIIGIPGQASFKEKIERVSDDVMAALVRYDWPGNIRELQNFIQRSVILTKGGVELAAPVCGNQLCGHTRHLAGERTVWI